MAKQIKKLTPRQCVTLTKPGRHSDGDNLYLVIWPSGSKQWVFLYRRNGKLREAGLGGFPTFTLAEARDKADDMRAVLKAGRDPLAERQEANKADMAAPITFEWCADQYIAAHEASWKNAKHRAQWRSTLETYAYPVFKSSSVAEIGTELVLKVLRPIWRDKAETASRLRGRIENVLDWAEAAGHRSESNPARLKGKLETLLGRRANSSRGHFAAIPWKDIPAFTARLRALSSISARALEFAMLCASRTNEVTGMTWRELDLSERTWIVPAARMKAAREHRVPLSSRALDILQEMHITRPTSAADAFVFPGRKISASLSDMALLECMRGLQPGMTTHGLRSSFSDWASESTACPSSVIEMALAHVIKDKVEAAYRRGDLLDKRRELMQEWTDYASGVTG